jgi:hypothetical protein
MLHLDLLPGDLTTEPTIRAMLEWWNSLRVCDDPGAATWGELELLERQVTDCLVRRPPDVARASSLTAEAMHRMTGDLEL